MDEQLLQLVKSHPVFSSFSEGQFEAAAACAMKRHYEAGSYITFYGDVWPNLLIVESGNLDVVKESGDGKQLVALSLGAGALFWGLAFFNDGMEMPVAVQAREQCVAYLWSRERILPMLMASPLSLWNLCQQMVTRMDQASQIVENLAFKPMAKRLAGFLLEQFSETGETSLRRSLTLDDIAARVGSTREEVCRTLYQFSDKNLIDITRTEFSLVDKNGLRRMADQH